MIGLGSREVWRGLRPLHTSQEMGVWGRQSRPQTPTPRFTTWNEFVRLLIQAELELALHRQYASYINTLSSQGAQHETHTHPPDPGSIAGAGRLWWLYRVGADQRPARGNGGGAGCTSPIGGRRRDSAGSGQPAGQCSGAG